MAISAPSQIEKLRELLNDGLPVTRSRVREACRQNGWAHADEAFVLLNTGQEAPVPTLAPLTTRRRGTCPASPVQDKSPVIVWDDDPIAIFSDFHIPSHDEQFIDRAVDRALAEGCQRFVIAGDLTDNNQWHLKRGLQYRQERKWSDDIDLARSILAYLCANFPVGDGHAVIPAASPGPYNIVFFGNHDEWVLNMTKGQATTDWLYAYLFPDLPIWWTYKRQIRVVQSGNPFMVLHGEAFSAANPMGKVEQYALHNRVSVVCGHMHYANQWESGPFQLVLNGGMFNRRRQDYIHEKPMPVRETQQGFTVIANGYARLFRGSDPTW